METLIWIEKRLVSNFVSFQRHQISSVGGGACIRRNFPRVTHNHPISDYEFYLIHS